MFNQGEVGRDPLASIVYQDLFKRSWVLIPIIFVIIIQKRAIPLTIAILSIVIYAIGYVFDLYNLGRCLFTLIFFLQIEAALFLIQSGKRCSNIIWRRFIPSAFAILLFVVSLNKIHAILSTDSESIGIKGSSLENFLKSIPATSEITFADPDTSRYLPALGRRVYVIAEYPPFFSSAYTTRIKISNDFFSQDLTTLNRVEILREIKANYILLDKKVALQNEILVSIKPFLSFNVVHQDTRWTLLKIRSIDSHI
jgi:hypothetical protein